MSDSIPKATWIYLGGGLWVIQGGEHVGIIRRHNDKWAAQRYTPTGRFTMGIEGLSRSTTYRKTLKAAMRILEKHWLDT